MTSAYRQARRVALSVAQWLRVALVACAFLGTQGCSVYLALHQPSSKDLSVLKVETPHEVIVAELGPPIWTETRGSETLSVHKFVQGYSRWMKGTRAILHAMADVPSFGLWEIPGTLIETFGLVGVPMTAKITYDADGKVQATELFDSRHIPPPLRAVQSGSLGLALAPVSQSDLQTPRKGRLVGAGRGAATGAVVGGTVAGMAVIWAPLLWGPVASAGAIVGTLPGAVYGAIAADAVSSVEKAEAILKTALQELRIPDGLRVETSTRVRQDLNLQVQSLEHDEVEAAHIQGSYPAFDSRGMTTMLELGPVEIELRNPAIGVNPDKQLIVKLSTRLIRTVDGLEIGSWYFIDTLGASLSLDRWAADNGRAFRAEAGAVTRRLADRVVREIGSSDIH